MKRKLLLLFIMLSLGYLGWGQTLLQWNTYGNVGTETTEPSVYNDPNISSVNLTQGSITAAANGNRFGGSGWFDTGNTASGNTLTEAIAGNDYIQFIVTPNSGYSFTPTSFVFQWDKSGTGPKNVTLRSSVDSYATDLGTVAPVAAMGTLNTITITGLTALTSATTFRLYGYGATATGGTGGFDVSSNVVNVQLNGSTASTGNAAPTVTTQAVSSIGTTTATGNGNITATGGVNASTRGICWDVYANPDPDITDSHSTESGDFGTGAFTGTMTLLSPETRYNAVAYATNSVGTGYGSAVNFWTLSTEPSTHSTTFANSVISQTQIDLSFDAASTVTNADGYIILQKTGSAPTGTPTDGNAYSVGNTIGDATVAAIVANTSATSANVTGLSAGTNYYFTLIPYNWNATDAATYNYKTDGTIPNTNGTTQLPLDATSEVSGPVLVSQPNPTLISSLVTTESAAIRVLDMDIYDYGSTDTQPTKITQVTIKAGTNNTADWSTTIQGVKLSTDAGSSFVTIGTPTITTSSIVIPITSGNLNIPNGNVLTVSLYVYLKNTGLTDNQVLEFDIPITSHGFTADATGSTFLTTFASATTSNQILIDVIATKLSFVQQPTNVGTSANITPSVTVSANDANGNRDLDYTTNVSITATGATLNGSPVSVAAVGGLATFSTLSFSTAATGATLDVTSGSLTGVSSNAFNVILLPAEGEIVINQFNPAYNGASNEYIELINKTNKTFDLSQLKIMYSSSGGSGPSSMGTLSGTLPPYSFWLLSPDATITVGLTTALARDGSFTAGMAATSGQIAVETLENVKIDGVAYGSISSNKLGEGNPAPTPTTAKDGLKRIYDGVDNNTNSVDFANVANADIYLRNHNSLCIPTVYILPLSSYPADIVLSGSSPNVTLSGNTIISGKLTIISGSLTVASSQSLTVSGTLTSNFDNSGLVIEDGASLITNGTVSGGATVKRTFTGPAWHLMSPPVSSQNIFTGYTDMYYYDETNNLWINHNGGTWGAGEISYLPGKGYLVSWTSGATKDFAGTINSGDYATGTGSVPALSFTTGKGEGYNLIGNPYPSAIIGSIDTWTKNNVDNSIWVYDNGNYLTWNGSIGDLAEGIIPAMQGFWIKANGSDPSLTIPNSARTLLSHSYYKESVQDMLQLKVEGNDYCDGIVINMNNDATTGYDNEYDVFKMYGLQEAPQMYSLASNSELSINVLPHSAQEIIVPVALKVGQETSYTISVKENTFNPLVGILLEDVKTNAIINLWQVPSYTFTANPNDDPQRFKLHFYGATGISESTQNDFNIYAYDNTIYINNSTGKAHNGTIEVYDITGRLVLKTPLLNQLLNKISVGNVKGCYIVNVVTNNDSYSDKVVF